MASRFFEVQRDGGVKVKSRGIVGKVIKITDPQGRVLRWDCYVGQRKVGQSKGERNGARLILKALGILEKNLQGGRSNQIPAGHGHGGGGGQRGGRRGGGGGRRRR